MGCEIREDSEEGKDMSKEERIQEYIKRYATSRGISEEEAENHVVVRAYMEYVNEE